MGELFGTDGIRGIAGRFPLDKATIARIGFALARELSVETGRKPLIISGRDTRESGLWIENALASGVRAAGAEIKSAGVITTPGVAYLTRSLPAAAGVVISASHNSFEDNGIKVFGPTGKKLSDATEQAIERDLLGDQASFPSMSGAFAITLDRPADFDPQLKSSYFAFLRGEIGKGLDLSGLKIVLDCAEGAASELAPLLFGSLGAGVTAIHNHPNGSNINFGCGSLHPEDLQQTVVSTGAALGIAFDGDADRLVLVDERGRLLDGDYILFILADYLSRQGRLSGNRVVATVMSNLGLEVALRERGIGLARTAVGDKYVLEELLENGGSLGGEQSGHIIFSEISLAGDGMITALEILRVIRQSDHQTLAELSMGMNRYPQLTLNVVVVRKPPLETVPPLREAIEVLEKELDGDGRLLVRYSGTESLLRIMIEGRDETVIRRQAEALAGLVREHLGAAQQKC